VEECLYLMERLQQTSNWRSSFEVKKSNVKVIGDSNLKIFLRI